MAKLTWKETDITNYWSAVSPNKTTVFVLFDEEIFFEEPRWKVLISDDKETVTSHKFWTDLEEAKVEVEQLFAHRLEDK